MVGIRVSEDAGEHLEVLADRLGRGASAAGIAQQAVLSLLELNPVTEEERAAYRARKASAPGLNGLVIPGGRAPTARPRAASPRRRERDSTGVRSSSQRTGTGELTFGKPDGKERKQRKIA